MRVLAFDLTGDFGHFKRYYTTSSPLTFSFPPPPTIKGILAAISGVDRDRYLDVFAAARCRIAIRILNPVKKIRMGINHINTKGNFWIPVKKGTHESRTQIRTEFLKNPAYRIYVSLDDLDMFQRLMENVSQHRSVFTVSLGLSELLGDFHYTGIWEFKQEAGDNLEIASVIPVRLIRPSGITFEEDKKYFKEEVPADMIPGRVVERYEDVLFEMQGKKIIVSVNESWVNQDGERITFF